MRPSRLSCPCSISSRRRGFLLSPQRVCPDERRGRRPRQGGHRDRAPHRPPHDPERRSAPVRLRPRRPYRCRAGRCVVERSGRRAQDGRQVTPAGEPETESASAFSDELERWLRSDGPKTLGTMNDVFADKAFELRLRSRASIRCPRWAPSSFALDHPRGRRRPGSALVSVGAIVLIVMIGAALVRLLRSLICAESPQVSS